MSTLKSSADRDLNDLTGCHCYQILWNNFVYEYQWVGYMQDPIEKENKKVM